MKKRFCFRKYNHDDFELWFLATFYYWLNRNGQFDISLIFNNQIAHLSFILKGSFQNLYLLMTLDFISQLSK